MTLIGGIWVPDSARPQNKMRVCITCGEKFPMAHLARFANHVRTCENGAAEEHVKMMESNVFTSYAEPDAREWISRRIAEGKPATKRGRPA